LVMAREFLREGARVAICARDEDELERAYEDLMKYGANVFTAVCDVTSQFQVAEMVQNVRYRFGQIDVLVNNAGTISVGPAEAMTLEDYEQAMDTNFWASLYAILAVLPEMHARQDGHIVNIASIGGKISVPHLLPYSASKFALVGLSSGLNAELRKDGVIVTTVCPGLMRTGSPRNANFKGQHQAEYAWFAISDSSPLTSISAESAAQQIIAACKRGDAEIILSPQAWLAIKLNALFPQLTADCLSMVNRWLLPAPGGIGTDTAKGKESYSSVAPSVLTVLDEKAARENNQIN
jgi:short-subunit dehydrogenase